MTLERLVLLRIIVNVIRGNYGSKNKTIYKKNRYRKSY